jgi:hypothetical protein
MEEGEGKYNSYEEGKEHSNDCTAIVFLYVK